MGMKVQTLEIIGNEFFSRIGTVPNRNCVQLVGTEIPSVDETI